MKSTIGLDFGTTNSTIGFNNGIESKMIKLTKDSYEDRTALFYNNEEREFSVGKEAIAEQVNGESGRLVMSPKSFLNSKDNITTIIGGIERSEIEIVSRIIKNFKNKLEIVTQEEGEDILVGRPVRFHDDSNELDNLAQSRLEEAVKSIGYKNVEFQYEPIAAARSYKEKSTEDENVIIADFGGGTSDFSILTLNSKVKGTKGMNVIANNGLYVGGDLLDYRLSANDFAKDLGYGSLQNIMGKELPVPSHYYHMLSDWKQIDKLRQRDILIKLQEIYGRTKNPELFKRLIEVSKEPTLGYEYYHLIEETKRELSNINVVKKSINIFSDSYDKEITRINFEEMISQEVLGISKTIEDVLRQSGLKANKINKIIMTGGTSLVPIVRQTVESLLGIGKIIDNDTFTSVGYGLTLESYERFR